MFTKYNTSEPALHINEINVNDKYKFLKQIGKGSYGEVWLVLPKRHLSTKSNAKQLVLKRLDLRQSSNNATQNDLESAEREAKLLSKLKHPNIVAYTESFRSNDGFLNIVMAYCEGGDLYTKIRERKTSKQSLTENQIIEWFVQICMALKYIHDKSILHRDLKTQNIFLTKNEIVKVGDLGIARVLDSGNDMATTIVGTPYYMSPEIFSHKPYGQKSDIWALGCCVYEMTTLEHAFNAKDMNSLVLKIIRGQTPQTSKKYSESLTDIITSMLSKNPEDRPTAKNILQNFYIKQHILRLLEQAKTKCQNQTNSVSQPIFIVPPASSSSLSAPSRSGSAASPSSSSNSPSSKNHQANRFSINSTPILPSYPSLPPTPSRPSSSDANRYVEPIQLNEAIVSESRARRRLHPRRSNPLPLNEQKDLNFLTNLSQNDTLQRRKRDQLLNNHLKQQLQPSSSDEHDTSPIRRPSSDRSSHSVIIGVPSRRQARPSSVESSDELNINSSRPQSHSAITKSYDSNQLSNPDARQRRRDNRLQSSSNEYSTPYGSLSQTTHSDNPELPRSLSQDNLIDEIEKKKEGEKDMNDLVFMLTATLQIPLVSSENVFDSNELTDSSNDSDKTVIAANGYSPISKPWSSGNRTTTTTTTAGTFHETNHLHQRCRTLREECLQEISPEKLRRVLSILENVSEAQMKQEMIKELGEWLYQKYSAQIFLLKFYEDNLLTHT